MAQRISKRKKSAENAQKSIYKGKEQKRNFMLNCEQQRELKFYVMQEQKKLREREREFFFSFKRENFMLVI